MYTWARARTALRCVVIRAQLVAVCAKPGAGPAIYVVRVWQPKFAIPVTCFQTQAGNRPWQVHARATVRPFCPATGLLSRGRGARCRGWVFFYVVCASMPAL